MSGLTSLFGDIADAIRSKKGTSADIVASNFPSEIMSIPTGTAPTGTKTVSITANGTRTEDVSGYANVKINTNVPTQYTPTGHRDYLITTNTGRIDDNVSGLASISIIVNVPSTSASNGYYANLQGSSYPEVFYTSAGSTKYLYFATAGVDISKYSHVIVTTKWSASASKVLAIGFPKSSSAVKWNVFNLDGTVNSFLQLNGNKIPLVPVSQAIEVYAVM